QDEWRHPKILAKSRVRRLVTAGDRAAVVNWIDHFALRLKETYDAVRKLLTVRDRSPELAELFVVDRMAPFWPLLIKACRFDSPNGEHLARTARLMETFAFRAYGIAGKRSDTGVSQLNTAARDFNGDFAELCTMLTEMCHWWDIDRLFRQNLSSESFY